MTDALKFYSENMYHIEVLREDNTEYDINIL